MFKENFRHIKGTEWEQAVYRKPLKEWFREMREKYCWAEGLPDKVYLPEEQFWQGQGEK